MSGPYCRVYWSIRDDERFAGVYHDDAALAAWLRLLIGAEGVYPAPADIPAWLRPDVMELLANRGLIEIVDSFHYRVHGLDAERERRSARGRAGAEAMWSARNASASAPRNASASAPRNATSDADALLAEQSRAETSRAEQVASDANASADDPAVVYAQLFGRPSMKATTWIDDLAARYGATETGNAIAQAVKDGIGRDRVLGVAESYLADQKRRALRTTKPKKVDPMQEAYRQAIAAKYGEDAEAEARFLKPINPDPTTAAARSIKEATA